MTIQGKKQLLKKTVLFFLADTVEIGGFKLGLSRSFRKCRQCLATHESMTTLLGFTVLCLCSCSLKQRSSPETYDYHCSLLNGPDHLWNNRPKYFK